jgi:hypothetical protein
MGEGSAMTGKPDFTLRIEIPDIHLHIHSASEHQVLDTITDLRKFIMSTKEEVLAELAAIKEQVDATAAQNDKANAEISAASTKNLEVVTALTQQVADLQQQIANSGGETSPEIVQSVAALKVSAEAAKASSQKLDDLTVDA